MSEVSRPRRHVRVAGLVVAIALGWVGCVPLPVPRFGGGGGGAGGGGSDGEKPQLDWQATFETLTHQGVTIATLARIFSFEAPVKAREPLVVEYRLARKGTLRLQIWVQGRERPAIFTFDGRAGDRKIGKRELPSDLGDWQAAQFSLAASEASGHEIDFRFYAIGVGKRAVGSTGIYGVTFEPGAIRGVQAARWGFRSHHDFERSGIAIYRREGTGNVRREAVVRVLESPCLPRRGEICEGDWDARDDGGNRSPGRHRVAVKAWQSRDERDWIVAMSEDEVTVE